MPEPTHRVLFKPIDNSETGGCHIDVYLPKQPKGAPIAWMIHGGGFTIGGSHHIPVDQVEWFLEQGVAVVSHEYRLLPHASIVDIRQDNVDAYKWILNNLNSTLKTDLDTSKVAVLGWSAGGTSALYLAHDAHKASLQNPTCLVPTYPKVQMNDDKARPRSALKEACSKEEWEGIERLNRAPVCTGYHHGIIWYKDDPSDRAIWMKATMRSGTMHSAWMRCDPPYPAETSPINLLAEFYPPTFVVVATADWLIPPAESHSVVEKLKGFGVEATSAEAKGMGHGICEDAKSSWPEDQDWWAEAILPSLEWTVSKLNQ